MLCSLLVDFSAFVSSSQAPNTEFSLSQNFIPFVSYTFTAPKHNRFRLLFLKIKISSSSLLKSVLQIFQVGKQQIHPRSLQHNPPNDEQLSSQDCERNSRNTCARLEVPTVPSIERSEICYRVEVNTRVCI